MAMNLLTKFLVVLNLIASVLFFSVSMSMFAKKVRYTDQLQEVLKERNIYKSGLAELKDAHQKLKEAAEADKVRLDALNRELVAANAELQRNVGQANARNAELQASVQSIQTSIDELNGTIRRKDDEIAELNSHANELKEQLDDSQERRRIADLHVIELQAEIQDFQRRFQDAKKQAGHLMNEVMTAKAHIDLWRQIDPDGYARAMAGGGSELPPDIKAKVVDVDWELGIVILNVGREQEVKPGTEFLISRGREYIGQVRVTNAKSDLSAAQVDRTDTKARIQVGDDAMTRL
jgi:predicted  nucleic acid-binding Zn-ribbon protein